MEDGEDMLLVILWGVERRKVPLAELESREE